MKKNLMAIILMLCLIVSACAEAEGLLPSLTDTIGKPMPSLGEALGRYPDEDGPNDDGGNIEVCQGVTETDFNTFSVYLSGQGATLADYRVSGSEFFASIQVDEKMIFFHYDTQTFEATVTYPKGTYDEWLDYAKIQFSSAVQLIDARKTDEALAVILSIPRYSGFKPIAEYFAANPRFAAAATAAEREAKLQTYRNVGGYVTFGMYPQTSDGNDYMPIEWIVLDYDAKSNRVLLISRYGLDAKPYHEERKDITWEKCTLRAWLNSTFYNNAFSANEQSAILLTNVNNSKGQGYSNWRTSGGNNTQDKIFLLSYVEANKYFSVTNSDSSNTKSRVSPTAYAIEQSADISSSNKTSDGADAGWWWLRSPGETQGYAANVYSSGFLNYFIVTNENGSVRPAFWLNLDSDIF